MLPGGTKNAIRGTRGTIPYPPPPVPGPTIHDSQGQPVAKCCLCRRHFRVFSSFAVAFRKYLWDLATLPTTRTLGPHSENQSPLAFLFPLPPEKPQCRHRAPSSPKPGHAQVRPSDATHAPKCHRQGSDVPAWPGLGALGPSELSGTV